MANFIDKKCFREKDIFFVYFKSTHFTHIKVNFVRQQSNYGALDLFFI